MTSSEALRRAAKAFLQAGVDLEGCRLRYVESWDPTDRGGSVSVKVGTGPDSYMRALAIVVEGEEVRVLRLERPTRLGGAA